MLIMNKIRFLLVCLVLFFCHLGHAQKFTVEKSNVTFFSKATVEDIRADNTKLASIFNTSTGEVAFSIPIKDFEFEKALMKEHFNEKYLETEKYPKATFQGKFSGYSIDAAGVQSVTAQGKLTIHGVTKEVTIEGTLENAVGKINAKSKFNVKLEEFKIKIPQLLWQNIAEQVEVSIDITYKPL